MDSKIIAIIAVVVVAAAAVGGYVLLNNGNGSNNSNNSSNDDSGDNTEETFETITVTDGLGKTVTLDHEVDKVALTDLGCVEFFATAYGDGWADHVCMMPADITSRDPSLGNKIYTLYPALKDLPTCPDLYAGLGNNAGEIAEKIIDTDADLVILPGATTSYLTGLESFYSLLNNSGVTCFEFMFYTNGLTDTVAGANYTSFGKLIGKEDRAAEIVEFYNSSLKVVTDRAAALTEKASIYYEIPGIDKSTYGYVVAMGVPEVSIVGTNVSTEAMDANYTLEKLQNADPDWIILVDTSYYYATQTLGYFMSENTTAAAEAIAPILARDGWSDIDAVKNNHVALVYGEFRQTMCGIYDLYNLANVIDKTLVSDDELAALAEGLDAFIPWGFEGYFCYVPE